MAQKRRWYRSRINIINVVLGTIGAAGAIMMVLALLTTFAALSARHGALTAMPTPSASSTTADSASGIFQGPVTETRYYTFNSAKDLKAFKQSGYGTVSITPGHRMRIVSQPATHKSVSITVTVDGGSTVSFDDQRVGNVDYDAASFQIDGRQFTGGTGNFTGSAKYQVYSLDPGKHTLTWLYFTDTTVNLPTDSYYVDNIKITNVLTAAWLAPEKN